MKKSAFSFLFVVLFAVMMFFAMPSVSKADSVSLMTTLLTGVVDKAVAKKETSAEKIGVLKVYQMLFTSPELSASKNQRIYTAVAKYIKEEITALQTQEKAKPAVPNVAMEIANVDVQKVRDVVLGWHNAERANVGVNAYGYDRDLEATAQTWANYLNTTATTSNTHVRNVGDGYYNYEKITEWFEGLGIEFPVLT
jgi:uncharacterized protein YkwD